MIRALLKNKHASVHCYAPNKQIDHRRVGYTLFTEFSIDECKSICRESLVDYVLIGSEQYLNTDVVEELEAISIKCICPNKRMAAVETSKTFARNLLKCSSLRVFNPDFLAVTRSTPFYAIVGFLNKWRDSVVVKADGLHGGKGVKVYGDHLFDRAGILACIHEILGSEENVVLEQKLEGEEFSFISITDGRTTVDCPPIQDYKRLENGNKGPNTGSMGCITDGNKLRFLTTRDILTASSINRDVIKLLGTQDSHYKGFLYGSYIKTHSGEIKVIEFNARLGDPEGIAVMEQLDIDFVEVCHGVGNQELHLTNVKFRSRPSLCTYLVPTGYPGHADHDFPVDLSILTKEELRHVNMASATCRAGSVIARGSRTLAIYYQAESLEAAESMSAALIRKITRANPGKLHFRDDLCGLYEGPRRQVNRYLESGVDVDEGNRAVSEITPLVEGTHNASVLNSVGAFGGCYGLRSVTDTLDEPVLVSSIDGVGTKSILALDHLRDKGFYNLGIDIVNHCINDVLVQGAVPLYFLDYIASSKIQTNQIKEFVTGVADACRTAGCALLGGETAEMPGVYERDRYDFVGCMTGVVDRAHIINGRTSIRAGAVMMALQSSGPHTNGYSLIRQLRKEHPDAFTDDLMNRLCVPHRSYLAEIRLLQGNDLNVRGLCHITGGGFDDNIKRVLPEGTGVRYSDFEFTGIFKELQSIGSLDRATMMKVFNCGYGMVVFVDRDEQPLLSQLLPEAVEIGTVEPQ